MPRRRRDDYPGAWHHVMNRSIEAVALFEDDVDRRIFLTELRDATTALGVEIHGYCLMSNHYHLLVHTPSGGLSAAMQQTASRFTQSVNRRRERDGPLFRGRFNSVEAGDDAHLVNISAYIHLNPVTAGLVTEPEAWPWSSAAAYFGDSAAPEWLQTGALLEMFGGGDGRRAYREFVADRHAKS